MSLYAWICSKFAKPGDRILDTHLGSGSSRIAAYDAGLDFTGYEIDKDYFEKQEERFAAHTAQKTMFNADKQDQIMFEKGVCYMDKKTAVLAAGHNGGRLSPPVGVGRGAGAKALPDQPMAEVVR